MFATCWRKNDEAVPPRCPMYRRSFRCFKPRPLPVSVRIVSLIAFSPIYKNTWSHRNQPLICERFILFSSFFQCSSPASVDLSSSLVWVVKYRPIVSLSWESETGKKRERDRAGKGKLRVAGMSCCYKRATLESLLFFLNYQSNGVH